MSLQITIGGVLVNAKVLAGKKGLTAAADGPDGSFGNILIDDISGATTIKGWRYTKVEETACSQPRLMTGWIGPRTYMRSEDSGTAGRLIDVTIVDQNAPLGVRLITGTDGKRPAETHNERIDWLLASDYLSGLVADYGFVSRTHPRPFEEADYRGQYPMDVLNDLAGPIFHTFHCYWDADNDGIGLFFDSPTAVSSTCALSITNAAGAADGVSSFYPQDARLDYDPSIVYSLDRYRYRNGLVLEQNATTRADFFDGQAPDGGNLGPRGLQTDNDRVGLESTARIMADGILDRSAQEGEVVSCTITVPASKVGLVDAGMRILCFFTHLPEVTPTATYLRIVRRTIRESAEAGTGYYDVNLEMSNSGLPARNGGGDPGGFPHPATCTTPTLIQAATATGGGGALTVTLSSTPTVDSTQVMAVALRSAVPTADPTGWTVIPEGTVSPHENSGITYYKTTPSGDTGSSTWAPNGSSLAETVAVIAEFAGTLTYDTSAELVSADPYLSGPNFNGATVTPTAGMTAVIVGMAEYKTANVTGPTAGSGWTLAGTVKSGVARVSMVYKVVTSTSGSYTPAFVSPTSQVVFDDHSYGAQTVAFICNADTPPQPGQWVYGETPTPAPGGGNKTFATAFPFADGSLKVYVDHVDETAAITTYDGATGSFTLAFDPRSWETLLVDYQGR